jgi:hypothetical protein
MPPRASARRRIWRPFRRLGLAVLIFLGVLLVPSLIGAGRAAIACKMFGGRPDASQEQSAAAPSYARREDQTYLTLPEWYVVFSADEYANYLAQHPPSGFPYVQATLQFWQAFDEVCAITRDRYPLNRNYSLMLMVVGTSFTAENIFKGIYENTIGRVSEWTSDGRPTPEELFGQQVAAEYGTFIHTIPWYDFPFRQKLADLWKLDYGGPNVIRRLERRFALTLELGIKTGYGQLISGGAATVFTPEDLTIMVRAEGITRSLLDREPQVRIVESPAGQPPLVALPRYEALTLLLPRLVEQGVRFTEIAGNDEIMVTVQAPRGWRPDGLPAESLFTLPILTQQNRDRVALRVHVRDLHTVVGELLQQGSRGGATFEHIFDY